MISTPLSKSSLNAPFSSGVTLIVGRKCSVFSLADIFPTFIVFISRPCSIRYKMSNGDFTTTKTFCPAYFPALILVTAVSLVMIDVLTFGGAAIRSTVFKVGFVATSSLIAIIRVAPRSFVHCVATCP